METGTFLRFAYTEFRFTSTEIHHISEKFYFRSHGKLNSDLFVIY